MKLFELTADYNVILSEEAYLLEPFKKIINDDKSKGKEHAVKEIAFVWFFADIKSDYNYILNEKDKEIEIRNDLKLPKTWKRTKLVNDAITFYIERSKTVSSSILANSLFIANTVSDKMKNLVSMDDLTIKEIDQVASGLSKMPGIVKSLQQLEQTVLKEIAEKSDKVGSQDKGLFEDGFI